MLHYLRWAWRQPRAWVALAGVVVTVALTSRDGRTGWTAFAAALTGVLAVLTLRLRYREDHPVAPREERFQAEVDKVLWRYEHTVAKRRVEGDDGDSLGSRGTE